ncbi:hypothetical protein BH11MYX2_BH11MYX2_10300 [soil metagenome]
MIATQNKTTRLQRRITRKSCALLAFLLRDVAALRGTRRADSSSMTKLVRIVVAFAAIASGNVASADDAATAKDYGAKCSMCHGADGRGQTAMGKKLNVKDWTDGKTLKDMSDTEVSKEIQLGKKMMPGFPALDAEALKAMVAFVRTLQR